MKEKLGSLFLYITFIFVKRACYFQYACTDKKTGMSMKTTAQLGSIKLQFHSTLIKAEHFQIFNRLRVAQMYDHGPLWSRVLSPVGNVKSVSLLVLSC